MPRQTPIRWSLFWTWNTHAFALPQQRKLTWYGQEILSISQPKASYHFESLTVCCCVLSLERTRVRKVGPKIRKLMFGLVTKAVPKKKQMPRRKITRKGKEEELGKKSKSSTSPRARARNVEEASPVNNGDSRGPLQETTTPSVRTCQAVVGVPSDSIATALTAQNGTQTSNYTRLDYCDESTHIFHQNREGDSSGKTNNSLRKYTSRKKKVTLHRCSNSTCSEQETLDKRFQSCGSCSIRYCSKGCAQQSWKSHRRVCTGWKSLTSKDSMKEQKALTADSNCTSVINSSTSGQSLSSVRRQSRDRSSHCGDQKSTSTSEVCTASMHMHTSNSCDSRITRPIPTSNVHNDVTCPKDYDSRGSRRNNRSKHLQFFDCSNQDCNERERIDRKFQKCGLCATRYCSVACSKRSWKTHKRVCTGFVARLKRSWSLELNQFFQDLGFAWPHSILEIDIVLVPENFEKKNVSPTVLPRSQKIPFWRLLDLVRKQLHKFWQLSRYSFTIHAKSTQNSWFSRHVLTSWIMNPHKSVGSRFQHQNIVELFRLEMFFYANMPWNQRFCRCSSASLRCRTRFHSNHNLTAYLIFSRPQDFMLQIPPRFERKSRNRLISWDF